MAKFGRFVTGLVLVGATVGAGLGAVVLGAARAGAATLITVTDAGDGAGPFNCTTPGGDCTLRAAIAAANTSGGDATITLPDASTVAHNPSASHFYSVINANGSLVLNDSGHTVTINGAGQTLAILQMQSGPITTRVLQVNTGTTADISGITAEGGIITGTGPGGGGILNDGTLNLSNSIVTGNAANSGGGVYLDGVAATLTDDTITTNSATSGGGLTMEAGTNVISGGSVDGNHTTASDGGGIDIEDLNPGDSANLSNVDVSSNGGFDGGGLYVGNQSATSNNPVTLTNVTADNNFSDDAGGGMYVSNDGAGGGTVTMTGGSVSGNHSASNGGGIYDQNNGHGSVHFTGVSVNSNTSSINAGGVYVQNDGTGDSTTFSGGSIDNNSTSTTATTGQGGGVYLLNNGTPSTTASFSGGSISGNRAYEGGGVELVAGSFPTRTGDLATFTNETVSGNNVTEAGGGFFDNAGAVQPLTIASSTISGNSAGTLATSDGGGIEAFAPPTTCSAITLTNDTITGNTAVNGGGYYGAGCTSPTVATAFKFDTISGNTATNNAGAGNIQTIDSSALTLAESIVANGSASGGPATNCAITGGGSLTSGGYNLIDNTNCGSPVATDIIGKNPQLGSLANNGGPTSTEEPAAASPAVGAIPSAVCSGTGVGTDQRGVARGAGANGSCTIGSVEVTSVPTVSAVSPNTGPTSGGTAITITGTGFVTGATVKIGQGSGAGPTAIAATNVKIASPTEITAVTGGGAKAGTWNLFVVTSGGTSVANSGDDFTYNPVPTVSAVSPNTGPTSGGTAITITGTGFVTGATVKIGQGSGAGPTAIAATNVKVASPTEITAVTGGGAKAGTWSLFVVTSGGTGIGYLDFTYNPVPTVSAVSPNTGPTSGGTAITITGTGFVTGATVKIGQGSGAGPTAIAATNVKVASPTEITAVTGGGAKAGTWSLFVVTSGGTGIGYLDFTYR